VDLAFLMDPKFKPPVHYDPNAVKKMRKIFVPVDKYPDYNFIGLIIGPRGNTQKRMEKETGCKISIRGKGSAKDGKNKKPSPGDDEDLHVMIMGTNDASVAKAAKMITDLLVPIDEDKNEIKRGQLRELAEINGTLVNRTWNGASAMDLSYKQANVRCAICGDKSHPTSDCQLRGGNLPSGMNELSGKSRLELEYEQFLMEIGENSPSQGNTASQNPDDVFAEFQAAISSIPNPNTNTNGNSTANHPWNDPNQGWNQQQQSVYGAVPPPPPSFYNQ